MKNILLIFTFAIIFAFASGNKNKSQSEKMILLNTNRFFVLKLVYKNLDFGHAEKTGNESGGSLSVLVIMLSGKQKKRMNSRFVLNGETEYDLDSSDISSQARNGAAFKDLILFFVKNIIIPTQSKLLKSGFFCLLVNQLIFGHVVLFLVCGLTQSLWAVVFVRFISFLIYKALQQLVLGL